MIRPARVSDAHDLARRVRQADRREIAAASGASPLKALLAGVRRSAECRAFCHNGRVEALFGVSPTGPGEAFPWLIGSDAIFGKAMWPFARLSRPEVNSFHAQYPTLAGWVHADNAAHVRWLEWCGFTVNEPEGGAMFRRFVKYV